jgi:hypothetical protein
MSLSKRASATNSRGGRGRSRPLEPQLTLEQYLIRDDGAGRTVSLETEHLRPIETDDATVSKATSSLKDSSTLWTIEASTASTDGPSDARKGAPQKGAGGTMDGSMRETSPGSVADSPLTEGGGLDTGTLQGVGVRRGWGNKISQSKRQRLKRKQERALQAGVLEDAQVKSPLNTASLTRGEDGGGTKRQLSSGSTPSSVFHEAKRTCVSAPVPQEEIGAAIVRDGYPLVEMREEDVRAAAAIILAEVRRLGKAWMHRLSKFEHREGVLHVPCKNEAMLLWLRNLLHDREVALGGCTFEGLETWRALQAR